MTWRTRSMWTLTLVGLMAVWAVAQTTNRLPNGGFESGKPSLFTAEAGAGAVLTWATDQMHAGTHSLKIAKTGTGASSRWVSGNNVRYWIGSIPKNHDIKLGAWVKTSGVNLSPATASDKWQLKFAFYDTNMVIIGTPVALDVDQSVTTRDWYADTNAVASVILPTTAYKLIISAEAGATATGTVWFDDFLFLSRNDIWATQNWNGFVDADSGWQYWIAPSGGNDGLTYFPGSGVVDGVARTGTSSLKIAAPVGRSSGELVWISETVPVTANKSYALSGWVKTSQIKKDSVFNAEAQLGYTVTWHEKAFADGGGWNEVGGDDYRFTLKDTASDWTRYTAIFTARSNATHASIRARSWHLWTGVSWWDDLEFSELSSTNLAGAIGGFESGKPSLFTAEAGAGAVLTWATDQMHAGTHSLKIAKTGTGASSQWVSGNNVRYWIGSIPKNHDIKLGAWVKTSGVNLSPATASDKWQLKFAFYDTNMVIIGTPVALDVDQSVTTRDWYADTNAVASVILPTTAYKLIISAEAGATATGTVWFDDFLFLSRNDIWATQNWNGFVDADSGWQYWIAPSGGNDGLTYFPGSGVVDGVARTGTSSLKIAAPVGRSSGELVWISETVPVTANKSYALSGWVKTSQIKKDSVFNAEAQLGYTVTWHEKAFADGGGWNEVGGDDYRFTLKDTASDWTRYTAIFTARSNATHASIRARSWHLWTGVSWWDDLEFLALNPFIATGVEDENLPQDLAAVPTEYALGQNYPNPFNPVTEIEFSVPTAGPVQLEVFNMLGQKVATLVNEVKTAGTWHARWNASDSFGGKVSSGLYLYRLTAPGFSTTKRMVLIK